MTDSLVRKKAVAKKAVAKKAVAKKAVAKKAVAKKAVAKKAVAKKAAPVRKKAVAKKAAPVRKKAVAKKAAPVRKKAVAKRAAPEKIATANLNVLEFRSASIEKPLLQRESKPPVFLKPVPSEIKKEAISTQGYSKEKSRKPLIIGFASGVLVLGVSVFSISNDSVSEIKPPAVEVTDVVPDDSNVIDPSVEEKAPLPTPSPSSTKSSSNTKPATANLDSFAPRDFSSNLVDQEISFEWAVPTKSSSVVGYELSTRRTDSDEWIVISSVTPQQLVVTVEVQILEATSEYRIASILENGKSAFNKTVITHPGVAG